MVLRFYEAKYKTLHGLITYPLFVRASTLTLRYAGSFTHLGRFKQALTLKTSPIIMILELSVIEGETCEGGLRAQAGPTLSTGQRETTAEGSSSFPTYIVQHSYLVLGI